MKKKTKNIINISLNILVIIINFIIYYHIKLNKINEPFINIIIITIIECISIKLSLSKKIFLYNISQYLLLFITICNIYNIINLNNKYSYIKDINNKNYQYKVYNVYVQKKNPKYNNLSKLSNKKIGTISPKDILQTEKKNIKIINYENIESLENSLYGGKVQAIAIPEEQAKKNPKILTNCRIIYSFIVKE